MKFQETASKSIVDIATEGTFDDVTDSHSDDQRERKKYFSAQLRSSNPINRSSFLAVLCAHLSVMRR